MLLNGAIYLLLLMRVMCICLSCREPDRSSELELQASNLPSQTSLQPANCQPASTAATSLAAPHSGPCNE